VFCGVLRCFLVFCGVFCVRVLIVRTKRFSQDRPKKIHITNKTNKIRVVQYSAIRCCASFSHSLNIRKKTFAKHVKKVAQRPAKRQTPQNTVFLKHLQNTAKLHKTHLLTTQTELANKPLCSHFRWVNPIL